MSRIDDLISRLCPDGVEYKKLNLVCKIYDGTHSTPDYQESGVKFVSVENIGDLYATTKFISEEAFEKYKIKPQIDDVLMTRIGSIGVCTVVDRDEPLAYYVSLALLRPDTKIIMSRYLKYVIESKHGRKELRKRTLVNAVPIKINKDDIGKIVIPVPPLEVQREIVQILDEFTLHTAELTMELTAELSARKKQYDYYGYGFFEFEDAVYKTISEIADTNIGLANSVTKHKRTTGVRLLHNSDIQPNAIVLKKVEYISEEFAKKNNAKILHKDDIITVHTGDVGTSAVINDEYDGSIGFTTITSRIKDSKTILPQYLCYYLNSDRCKADIAKMTISDRSNLNQKEFKKLIVPIPSIEEQRKVIMLLDEFNTIFDTLMSDISDEIALIMKRYEYYRDKLLTFKEAV